MVEHSVRDREVDGSNPFTPTNSPSRRRYGAFTLIELLVVIAIIAIIAAILFPVFARARDRAKQTTCLSNLKQMGLAVSQYADDHDDMLPVSTGLRQCAPTLPTALPNVISTYVKSPEVFRCPADGNNNRFDPEQVPGFWPSTLWKAYGSSYSYSSQPPGDNTPRILWQEPWWRYWRGGRKRTEFRNASKVGMLCDTNPWHHTSGKNVSSANEAQAGFNVLFADSHVTQLFGDKRNVAMGQYPDPDNPD